MPVFSNKCKQGVLQILQHAQNLYKHLRSADVGADIIRPRAIDNRPYKFY